MVLPQHDSCSNSINKSSAGDVDTDQVCGYSSTIVKDRSKEKITTYSRGEDILSKLCKELHEKALELINTEKKELIPLTPDQEKEHNECKRCHICNKTFIHNKNSKYYKNKKVIDHDHYTGIYSGAGQYM